MTKLNKTDFDVGVPHIIREAIRLSVQKHEAALSSTPFPALPYADPRLRGALIGHLSKASGGSGNTRRAILHWIFADFDVDGPLIAQLSALSTKKLSVAQWSAIGAWINSQKDDEGIWRVSPDFERDYAIIRQHVEGLWSEWIRAAAITQEKRS
jgi:hypothetical protein